MSIKGFNINGNVEKYDYESLDNIPDVSGSGGEEWVELLNSALAEDVAYVDLIAPDDKKFKKLHIQVHTVGVGLSASSKIIVKGKAHIGFDNSNGEGLVVTNGTVNTWAYPTFIIEKGEFFPLAFATNGAVNGSTSAPLYMGGAAQNNIYNYKNNGPWKIIRIQPQTAGVVFKKGISIYAWGVYE